MMNNDKEKMFETADSRMAQQCIRTLMGLERKVSADINREFNWIEKILSKEVPKSAIAHGGITYCPHCGHELFDIEDYEDDMCFRCDDCGQLTYWLMEE